MFKSLENAYEFAALPLRIGLAALFVTTGILQLMDTTTITSFMSGIGLPAPIIFAVLVMASYLVGGVFLLLGLLTRITAIWMTVVLAFLTVVSYCLSFEPANIIPLVQNVAVIGGTLCLMLSGPGKWSLDEKYFWE